MLLGACNNSQKNTSASTDSIKREPIDGPEEVQQISEVITRFARAYLSQDNQKVNNLIHPDYGIAIIYRPGVMDTFVFEDSLDFKNPVPNHYVYNTFTHDKVLTFEKLPEYDCGTEKWSKLGFFCDTAATSVTHILDTLVKYQEEFNEVKYDDNQKKQIDELEDGSYRVILNPTEENFIVFHVKQFGTAWYVTILDRSYGFCDA